MTVGSNHYASQLFAPAPTTKIAAERRLRADTDPAKASARHGTRVVGVSTAFTHFCLFFHSFLPR